MAIFQSIPWHLGETRMGQILNAPLQYNPTTPTLSPQLFDHLYVTPLISVGTLDSQGHPWTTLWGSGVDGLSRPLDNDIIIIHTPITGEFDPVIEELAESCNGSSKESQGKMISGLTIDLETRERVKMFGRVVTGAIGTRNNELAGHTQVAEIQLTVKIEQSLGNCPKYLNKKQIVPAVSKPELVYKSPQLHQRALDLLEKADLFFISSSQHNQDMDTNHRGGPPGFLRVASNEPSGAILYWPEYSGNRLYQTLGNLYVNPVAGICVPDFETGDMLYLTGTTEILIGKDAAAVMPKSNLCVKITVTAARFVAQALPFRGIEGERSPYNPTVRYLTSENAPPRVDEEVRRVTLLSQTTLTPTVSRFRFKVEKAVARRSGQYVTLDFSDHLDLGYSHMRNDDPQSLNDDFVRTFTVSSPPSTDEMFQDDEFEITVRKVGVATKFLFGFGGDEKRTLVELKLKGFGGEFEIRHEDDKETVAFIAAGTGVTPILPSLHTLDLARLRMLWTIRQDDIPLVLDVLQQHPQLANSLSVFVTDTPSGAEMDTLNQTGAKVELRRLQKSDLDSLQVSRYYLCTAIPLRKQLIDWLHGEKVVYEDFNF